MFNAHVVKEDLIKWIYNWYCKASPNHDKNIIIGISGGKDSSIVAALCCEAIGNTKVIGVLLPNGNQSDINYSMNLVEYLRIPHHWANIEKTYHSIIDNIIESAETEPLNNIVITNIPPRIRMTYLYAYAALFNGFVVGTDNLSENYIGWTTKWGSAVSDFSPLANLTCTEVRQIGYALNLPKEFIDKIPEDGLTGKSDEEIFGFSYDELDCYIRFKSDLKNCYTAPEVIKKIKKMHKNSRHKFNKIQSYKYDV